MNLMDIFHGQLEITRRHIIGQLEQEIAILQQELGHSDNAGPQPLRQDTLRRRVISRKRRLIASLR